MASLQRSLDIGASPDAVWRIIGDFGDLNWHPAIASTTAKEQEGAYIRTLTLGDGVQIIERQTAGEALSYSYTILTSPLPLANYHSTLKVEDAGGGASRVVWSSTFEPAAGVSEQEACGIVAQIYEAGLEALNARF